jgi:hypothetical protein
VGASHSASKHTAHSACSSETCLCFLGGVFEAREKSPSRFAADSERPARGVAFSERVSRAGWGAVRAGRLNSRTSLSRLRRDALDAVRELQEALEPNNHAIAPRSRPRRARC